jgi:hypothetical protein
MVQASAVLSGLIVRQWAPGPFRGVGPEWIDFIALEAQKVGSSVRR